MTDPYRTQHAATTDDSAATAAAKDAAATAKDTAAQAKDAAAGVADTGKQAATEVAQTGKDAALEVTQQAKEQASDLLGETKQQLNEQVVTQQASIVDTLRALGDQLASMTENTDEQGTAVDLAAQGRDRARSAADWLDQRNPDQVLDELRRVGRERPGAFLLGAALAGAVAGRLTRGVVAEHTNDDDTAQVPSAAPDSLAARPQPGRHNTFGDTTAASKVTGTAGWSTP